MPASFRILEHTADIGFEARADTAPALFETSVRALLSVAVDVEAIDCRDTRVVRVTGDDYPSLLVNLLEEVLFLFDSSTFATGACAIEALSPVAVTARLRGEPRVPERHRWTLMVKAVTYHGLVVVERDDHWLARVFLDV